MRAVKILFSHEKKHRHPSYYTFDNEFAISDCARAGKCEVYAHAQYGLETPCYIYPGYAPDYTMSNTSGIQKSAANKLLAKINIPMPMKRLTLLCWIEEL